MDDIILKFPKEGEELTFGQKAVGLSFNPSKDPEVDKAKLLAASAIDQLHDMQMSEYLIDDKYRHFAIAITDYETAQMRAVKAITWR